MQSSRPLLVFLLGTAFSGCGVFTDAATRIAFDIETGVARLGREEGATLTIQHATPSNSGECGGPFKVQFDKVGALIIWCKDETGQVVSSHSTTFHARFVDTRETHIVDKQAKSVLLIRLERIHGRAVITSVL